MAGTLKEQTRASTPTTAGKPAAAGAPADGFLVVGAIDGDTKPKRSWKPASTRVPYLPGLDGLRAIAVIGVLLYHAELIGWWGTRFMPGGFLGVEVFFVISGYLITAILLAQWRNDRKIDLKTFYVRRARRLLPALFAVLIGVTLLCLVFFPDEIAKIRGDIAASLAYVTNWFFVYVDKSYVENMGGRQSLVQHLWSLAIEEQFYLVWPLLFAFGMRRWGRRRLLVGIVAGAVLSTLLMAALYRPGVDPSRVYFGTDTRAAGLLIGAALAFVWPPYRLRTTVGRGASLLLDFVGVMAFVGMMAMLFIADYNADALYRGGFALLAVLAGLVIAVTVHPAAHLGKLLGCAPLRWIGLRSYGIYLYHWPVFQLTRPQLDVPLSGLPLLTLRLVLTVAIAEVSYRYIETPIRNGVVRRQIAAWRTGASRTRWRLSLQWGTGALATIVALALLTSAVVRAQAPETPDYLAAGSTTAGLPPGPGGMALPPRPTASTVPSTTAAPVTDQTAPADTVPVSDPSAATTTVATSVPPAALPLPTVPPPATPAVPNPTRRITAIGDSVMLGAAATMEHTLNGQVFVDARVSRQVSEALGILRVWRDNGLLGDVVVVQVGNNGTFTEGQFAEMRDILSGAAKVIFLTVQVPRVWETPNNQVITNGAWSMPNAVLIDWKSMTDPHPELFASDGMHLNRDGATYYANLINERL